MSSALLSDDVDLAVERLRVGGLVAFPTETVYGLGAAADDPAAVARIFRTKGRPTDHPLIVHLADVEAIDDWAIDIGSAARTLAASCWPGPLTLLLHRSPRVDAVVTGGRATVGIRIPAHPVAQALLARFGGGVAAPSANRFGHVSATTAAHVVDDLATALDPRRDLVLDGGATPVGVESTIVDCTTDPPQLLRPGAVTADELATVLAGVAEVGAAQGPSRAAGMLASHYAPRRPLRLVADREELAAVLAAAQDEDSSVAVIDFDDLGVYAASLYDGLRRADASGADLIIAVLPPATGLGLAIRDRLAKAAAPRHR